MIHLPLHVCGTSFLFKITRLSFCSKFVSLTCDELWPVLVSNILGFLFLQILIILVNVYLNSLRLFKTVENRSMFSAYSVSSNSQPASLCLWTCFLLSEHLAIVFSTSNSNLDMSVWILCTSSKLVIDNSCPWTPSNGRKTGWVGSDAAGVEAACREFLVRVEWSDPGSPCWLYTYLIVGIVDQKLIRTGAPSHLSNPKNIKN